MMTFIKRSKAGDAEQEEFINRVVDENLKSEIQALASIIILCMSDDIDTASVNLNNKE